MVNGNGKELDQMLVPIDVSKYFHKAMVVGPHGEVLQDPFEIDIYQEGLEKLFSKIKEAQNGSKDKRIIFAMEPTSYYHQSLLESLGKLGHEIQLVSPYITAQVRKLDYDHLKTDQVDVKTLGRSVLLGKGRVFKQRNRSMQKLRALTRQRLARTHLIKIVKTQINKHMDTLWPGFVNRYQREKGLVWNIWESQMAWAIMQVCPNPKKVAKMSISQLIDLFKKHKVRNIGPKRALKIITHAQSVIHKSFYLPEIQQNLKQDIHLLHHLNTIVSDLENKAVRLLPEEAKYLLSIKGISPFYAAAFLAEIEKISNFASPKKLIRYTGLSVAVKESGMYKRKENYMTKSGNRYLRYIVMTMARNVSRCHPDFRGWYEKFTQKGMGYQEAIGCVATKLLKIVFFLLSRKELFSSEKFQRS